MPRFRALSPGAIRAKTSPDDLVTDADHGDPQCLDHAAGVLIHAEAGGHSALMDGRPYSPIQRSGYLLTAPDKANWEAIRHQLNL